MNSTTHYADGIELYVYKSTFKGLRRNDDFKI